MLKLTLTLALIALTTLAHAQFVLIPNGDFSSSEGQQWNGSTSDASISFPSTGGNPDGYGLIVSSGNGTGWGGVLVQEGGSGPYPAAGNGISLETLGLVAGETYTFQWDMKNFTSGSTLPAGIKLESWKDGGKLSDGGDKIFATSADWVSQSADYTIDAQATALKVVMVNNQGLNGPSSVGFDNVGLIQTEPTYVLSLDPLPTHGTVEGVGVYLENVTATLTAIPSEGFLFSNWMGDASGSDNPLSVVMNANKVIGVVFQAVPREPLFVVANGSFEQDESTLGRATPPTDYLQAPSSGVSKAVLSNGNPVYNPSLNPPGPDSSITFEAFAGTKSLKMSAQDDYVDGTWSGPIQTGVIYQEWSVGEIDGLVAGAAIHATAAAKIYPIEPLTGTSEFRYGFRFFDGGGGLLGEGLTTLTAASATNAWATLVANGTIPSETATVRLICEFEQGAAADQGSVYLDDLSAGFGPVASEIIIGRVRSALAWSDEFDGSVLKDTNWTPEFGTGSGGWGNGESQSYTDDPKNLSVKAGSLLIHASKDNGQWTSARIKTQDKRVFTHGYIEVRAKLPSGVGVWPAAWTLGNNISSVGWPNCGEIDYLEYREYPSNQINTIGQATHTPERHGGNPIETDPRGTIVDAGEWNTYAVSWGTDGSTKFFVDGSETGFWNAEITNPQFLLLNLAIGGAYNQFQIADDLTEASYELDYIRVYQPIVEPPATQTLQIDPDLSHGSIGGGGTYDEGSVVEVTATADAGFFFGGWTGDASGSDNPLALLMDQDKTIGANFVAAPPTVEGLLPNGDFTEPSGKGWNFAGPASIEFPSTGGSGGSGGYGSISTTSGSGWGVLVSEGGTTSAPSTGSGIPLGDLGVEAGETYTWQWDMKNFTAGSTLPAGIKLESWVGGSMIGDSGDQLSATSGDWVTYTFDYLIDPAATALKVVMVFDQASSGTTTVGFDNIGLLLQSPPVAPAVATISLVAGVPTISVYSLSGHFYQLEASPSLDSGWLSLSEERPGTGAILEFTDTTTLPSQRFYRIKESHEGVPPAGLGFLDLSNAAPSSLSDSNAVWISGLNQTESISITNGQYAIDGGAYTTVAGTISNGQVLSLRQIASTQLSSTVDTVITIGGVSDAFSVTTSALPIPLDSGRLGNLDGVKVWQLPTAPNGDRPDQCWLAVGSDTEGDIYISGHDHVSNSMLYRLHQSDGVLRWVGDAETASLRVDNWLPGETAEKFHTRPLDYDGRVYVATLDSSNMNTDYLSTRGFHWYGYESLGNELLDLSVSEPDGVGWPTLQIVTIQKDTQNNLLYGMSVPTNELVSYDIASGETTLLGKPDAWTGYFYSNRYIWVDSRGRVYITGGSTRGQWNQGESASTFDHVWYYDPTTGFGQLLDFPLEGANALEVGQWDRTGDFLYTADDQGHIYRFTDATASWTFVGQPDFGAVSSGVPKTWVFQVSPDAKKIYIGVSDVSYPNSIWEYDIATGTTTELAKLSELDAQASSQDFITGYDSWDDNGSFYISSFSMYNGVNVYMIGIDPVRLKAAKDNTFELVEVTGESAVDGVSISRTGSTSQALEVLYQVKLFDVLGTKLQTLAREVNIAQGQAVVELGTTSMGLPSATTFTYAEFSLVADGNDYVLAASEKIILN